MNRTANDVFADKYMMLYKPKAYNAVLLVTNFFEQKSQFVSFFFFLKNEKLFLIEKHS